MLDLRRELRVQKPHEVAGYTLWAGGYGVEGYGGIVVAGEVGVDGVKVGSGFCVGGGRGDFGGGVFEDGGHFLSLFLFRWCCC